MAVAPLNAHEILIMGGYKGGSKLNDIIIFDIRTNSCKKVVTAGNLKFDALTN